MNYTYHTLDVNGVDYESIPPKKIPKSVDTLNRISMMYGGGRNLGLGRTPVDQSIMDEYGLIQLKQSNLSSNKRRWIVYVFEKSYRLIDTSVYYEIIDGKKFTVENTEDFLHKYYIPDIKNVDEFHHETIEKCKAFLERSKGFVSPI